MKLKKTISLFLAGVFMLGSVNAVLAEEKEVGEVINADIGFVGGDFENVTLTSGEYYAPDMAAFTTYGTSHTIDGLSTKTTGSGKLPIVVENGNKVFKLQPSSLSNAVSGKSLNNAFGMKLVTISNMGKIKDITGDVTVSFRMKVTDPECLEKILFAVRPSHTDCGQYSATTAKFGETTVSGSEITTNSIKNYFPAGEWVNVELTFAKSTFYDRADFATHTWGGSHGDHTVTAENAKGKPVFYIRPSFNYGTTSKDLSNYSIYLDDFSIDAPTSAESSVKELETNIIKDAIWTKGTMDQATKISEETKNGYDAYRFDPAINTALSGFEPSDGANWERAGQRANVETSLRSFEFEENAWYKLTAYVMVQDGVGANETLGTSADSEKTWVGKSILGIKMTGAIEQNNENWGNNIRYKNNTISPEARTEWQKVELTFRSKNTKINTFQLNATAGINLKYWGIYQNMVLPTYWVRKDIKLEKIDTEYIPQNGNIVDLAAPYYLEGSNGTGWFYAHDGVYTAYPKQSGRPVDVMGQGLTFQYNMAEPLDKTKNYRISFNIETDTNRVEKARVTFFTEGNRATLTKIIPEDALTEATEMVFDTRDLVSESTSPLVDLGDVTAIGITIDSSAAILDGSVASDVMYEITNLKITRIEPNLKYAITLSGNKAVLEINNETNANWSFKGRLFVAEYDENDCLLQLVAEDVDIALKNGETVSIDGVFKRELADGSMVKAFLWEPDDISPIIEAKVLR